MTAEEPPEPSQDPAPPRVPSAPPPEPGGLAKDIALNRMGVVLTRTAEYTVLRPVKGGALWETPSMNVVRLSAREELSARLALVNLCQRWGK